MLKAARLFPFMLIGGLLVQTAEAAPPEGSKAPEGFVEMFVAGVLPTEGGPAVVLRDKTEKTLIPIWIGMSEAHSIQLRLERRRFPRPLTHDLLDQMVHDLGGEILKIHVDDLKGDTFVGTVFVKRGDKISHYDARPSDSIALAVGNKVPIFVSRAVIERINTKKEEGKDPFDEEEEDEGEEKVKASPKSNVQTLSGMFEEKPRSAKPIAESEEETEARKVYVCRRCETEITDSRAMFCMRAGSVEQVFPNPLGMMRVILTARSASSISVSGDATADFTWFAGYAWRIAYCASCMSHLGWLYEGDGEPRTFYGLLKEALAER